MANAMMQATIEGLSAAGKGVLAADESVNTLAKRFNVVGVDPNDENRRRYRSLLVTAPEVEKYLAGIIFFEETVEQSTDAGEGIVDKCAGRGILPGIKVDRSVVPLVNGREGEKLTQGFDGLADRLARYRDMGLRFTKWRAVYSIANDQPSPLALEANADGLARYAAECQDKDLVPIVEPEILMEGDHDLARSAEVTEQVHASVFAALRRWGVELEHMVLKPNMVVPGRDAAKASPEAVAEATLNTFRRSVPAAVPAIHFLSGGPSAVAATRNLDAINRLATRDPWQFGFSYGRALQEPAQKAWLGDDANIQAAQSALAMRARLNSAARAGRYSPEMETTG